MNSHMTNMTLDKIREGMDVYDSSGNKIGTVEDVQFGDENRAKPGPETATAAGTADTTRDSNLVRDIARALGLGDDVPEEVQARMLRYGFVRVDTGILSSDAFFTPDQINAISDDSVSLAVDKDSLTRV